MLKELLVGFASIASYFQPILEIDQTEVLCLADAIWVESRGEPIDGQKAVARVIINRVGHREFPNTICENLTMRNQFPWRNQGLEIRRQTNSYKKAIDLAWSVMLKTAYGVDFGPEATLNATFFNGVPFRYRRLKFSAEIGGHLFYELKT